MTYVTMMFDDDFQDYDVVYNTSYKVDVHYNDEDFKSLVNDDIEDCESIDDILDTVFECLSKEFEEDEETKEEKTEQSSLNTTKYHFNFPKMACPSVGSQVHKVLEEANEIQEAVNLYSGDSYSRMKIVEETLDCIHACETFLTEIALSEDEIDTVKDHVLHKNARRGYYDSISS